MADTIESTSATRTFTTTCHCRQSMLSFTVPKDDLPLPVHFCHCSICRQTHGTLCSIHATIPPPAIDFSSYTKYQSSDRVTRWFCTTCGAHLLDRSLEMRKGKDEDEEVEEEEEEEEEEWHVAVSLVDAGEEIWDFQSHIYVGSTRDGGLATLLTKIGGKTLKLWNKKPTEDAEYADSGDWTPSPPSLLNVPADPAATRTALKAACHCGGISFTISRPSGPEFFTSIDPSLHPTDKSKFYALHDACTTCRLTLSSFPVSWLFPPRTALHLTDPHHTPYPANGVFGTAKAYASSDGVMRTFCGTCGAGVTYTCADRPDMIDVAAGLLVVGDAADEAKGVRAEEWFEWRTHRLAYEEDAVWKGVLGAFKEGLEGGNG